MMDKEIQQLKQIAQENLPLIQKSAVFMGICSDDYTKDPVCLIQLALSILLDKPLFLVIAKGTKPSKNLIRILEGYEFYEPDDIESFKKAGEKLTGKIKTYLAKETPAGEETE